MYIYIGKIAIPAYGICMASGLLMVAILSCMDCYKKQLSIDNFIIYFSCVIGCALIGAKFIYILVTYELNDLLQMVISFRWKEIFNNSGLVFYGGLLGGMLGIPIGNTITGEDARNYYSSVIPNIPLGHAIGRVGCFLAGCCYGKEYHGIGSVTYNVIIDGAATELTVIPIQLMEGLGDIFIMFFLYWRRKKDKKDELLIYCILYAGMRFGIEYLRGDTVRGNILFFSVSQWISIMLLTCGCLWMVNSKFEITKRLRG